MPEAAIALVLLLALLAIKSKPITGKNKGQKRPKESNRPAKSGNRR